MMKILAAVAMALLLGPLGGCDKESPHKPDATDQDARVAGDDVSPGTQGELRDPGNGGCQNVRQFSDWKNPGDHCWDPPLRYCSDGASAAETAGCNGDGTVCCIFPGDCLPCAWLAVEDVCGLAWDREQEAWEADDPANPPVPSALCGGLAAPSNLDADGQMLYPHAACPFIDTALEICWDDAVEQLDCELTSGDFGIAATQELEGLTSCTDDEGCLLVTPELECPEVGVHLVECPMAVGAGSADAFEAGIAALAGTFCAPGVLPCKATPGCPPSEAKCVEGKCQVVLTRP